MPSFLELFTLALILALSGVFAAYETALSAVSLARLVALQRKGMRGAEAAVWMKEHIERSFAVCQLGMTLLAAIAGAFSGVSVEERLAPQLEERLHLSPQLADFLAITAVVIPLAVFTILFAELTPKVLALRHRDRVCTVLSPPMRALSTVIAPIVTVLERLTKAIVDLITRRRGADRRDETSLHELAAAAALARTSKLIGAREERIVRSAALLSSRALEEIELPVADISTLPIDLTLEQALVRAHLDMHTRFPVARIEGDPQTIEGYVTFKDLVALMKMSAGAPTLRAATRPIQRIKRSTPISHALDRMVRERTHIALVVDDADRVTGMVTLEDILEELVGDIEDEFDRLPAFVQQTGDGFIVGGGTTLEVIAQKTGIELPTPAPAPAAAPASGGTATAAAGAAHAAVATSAAASTTSLDLPRPHSIAEWLHRELGRAPHGGESLSRYGLLLLVRKLRRKRLAEAFVRRVAQ
jgi:putative hemolysin